MVDLYTATYEGHQPYLLLLVADIAGGKEAEDV